jgi:hypothetical protein
MLDRLHLRRFNITQYHTMKRLGILSPNARVELLEGIVTDMHRPSPRELEVIGGLAEALAAGLDAELHAAPPAHPESYATFDPALMVHDWENFPLTEPLPLHRFSVAEYHRLIEAGIVPRSPETELIDGVVFEAPVRSERKRDVVGRMESSLGISLGDRAMWRIGTPIRLGPYSEVRPDTTLIRPRPDGFAQGPPTGTDVWLLVDVRDEGDDERQMVEWPVYARWGVNAVSLVDLVEHRLLVGTSPRDDRYTAVAACREHETIHVPVDGTRPDILISAASIFARD